MGYSSAPPSAHVAANQEPAWKWEEAKWRKVVNKVRAGRSLKPKRWKDGARACVALSFDSDHESGTLREGSSSPGRLSQGQYGNRVGIPRILKLLGKYSIPASFFVPAVIAKLYPDEQRRVVKEGHEIGIHGWIHELNSELGLEDERDLMRRSFDTLAEITGKPPVGMRTPSWDFSQHTLKIVRELGLLYDSSLMADDDPYELMEDGQPTGVVELPVEWIKDDAPYMNMNRFSAIRPHTTPGGVLSIFKSEFDMAVEEESLCLITMHPHIMGHRSRMAALEELIKYMKGFSGVWFATHEQVARYCKENA
ncbi:MAG: polysaccharide deacetylase [Proteobacteria bacterium]|nr:polysaccharide deacetylase [Pseudomonadota bacterium]